MLEAILIRVTASTMPFYHRRALYDDTTPDRGRRMREEYLATGNENASPGETLGDIDLLNSGIPLESSDVLGAYLQKPDGTYSLHHPLPFLTEIQSSRAVSRGRRRHRKEIEKDSGIAIVDRELSLEQRMKIEAKKWFKTRRDLSNPTLLCKFLVATKDFR